MGDETYLGQDYFYVHLPLVAVFWLVFTVTCLSFIYFFFGGGYIQICVEQCLNQDNTNDIWEVTHFSGFNPTGEFRTFPPTMASCSSVGDNQLQRIIRDLHGD